MMYIPVDNKENARESIIAIGEELIKRADDITNDMKHVSSIIIHAELSPQEIANFDVTKNYAVTIDE